MTAIIVILGIITQAAYKRANHCQTETHSHLKIRVGVVLRTQRPTPTIRPKADYRCMKVISNLNSKNSITLNVYISCMKERYIKWSNHHITILFTLLDITIFYLVVRYLLWATVLWYVLVGSLPFLYNTALFTVS